MTTTTLTTNGRWARRWWWQAFPLLLLPLLSQLQSASLLLLLFSFLSAGHTKHWMTLSFIAYLTLCALCSVCPVYCALCPAPGTSSAAALYTLARKNGPRSVGIRGFGSRRKSQKGIRGVCVILTRNLSVLQRGCAGGRFGCWGEKIEGSRIVSTRTNFFISPRKNFQKFHFTTTEGKTLHQRHRN